MFCALNLINILILVWKKKLIKVISDANISLLFNVQNNNNLNPHLKN